MKANYRQAAAPSNMQGMIKQAQKMQEQMAEAQAALEEKEYEIKAGGGAVTVKISGKKEIVSLDIQPEIVDPDDIETLSDIIIAGVNEAIKKVGEKDPSMAPLMKFSRAYESGDKILIRVEGSIAMLMLNTPEMKSTLAALTPSIADRTYTSAQFEFTEVPPEAKLSPLDELDG